MNAKRLVTIAVATLVLLTAGVAAGAASPVDQASDNAPDEVDTDDDTERGADADPADGDRSVGPSDGLPEQVPDHVSRILDSIDSFLSGSVDSLGEALADLLGNGSDSGSNAAV
jgi:hypothetical protein